MGGWADVWMGAWADGRMRRRADERMGGLRMGETLIDQALAAHGGIERWRRVRSVALDVRIGGNILLSKFKSPSVRRLRVIVDARRVAVTLTPFPREHQTGIFENDQLRIVGDDGRILSSRDVVRRPTGDAKVRMIWDDLDVLYFLGYALWNYTLTPFVFTWPGFACRESGLWRERSGEEWRMLDVRFPHDIPTHCRDQRFYFDRAGLLRRLDYTADVFGRFASGAHLCCEHRTFDGFVWPTHRVVHPKRSNGQPIGWLRVMEGWITSAAVQFGDPVSAT